MTVGMKGGKKSKSAYEKRQSRHGRRKEESRVPTKKDRVGTKGGKKSKSAYEKRQSRHGRRKEEQECLQKKTE